MKNPFTKIRLFYGETTSELRKTSWPTPRELRDHTIVVLVATLLLGGYIALADFSVREVVMLLINLVK